MITDKQVNAARDVLVGYDNRGHLWSDHEAILEALEAAHALEAQAQRIEHLHNDMKFMDGKNDELRALLEKDRDTIDELRARIAELEAALKPFADCGVWDGYKDEEVFKLGFKIADLRAARAAMGESDE